jgi:predicted NBD/HSP70 family sugar kinase
MSELIGEALVREDGEENSTGGRPGRRLQLEPRRVSFGAEIQNWETRLAICTIRGRIVESWRFRTPSSVEATLERIAREVVECRKRFGTQRVAGIGIAARGIVNADSGMLVLGSRPDWVNVPVRTILEAKLREPVFLENNVRAAALAEYNYGSADLFGSHSFLFVKMDEGVGMGIVLEGKLYRGPRMAAGEFGQMVIAMASAAERHDRPGCLERLASNPALCERYSALIGERRTSTGDTSTRVRRIVQLADSVASAREAVIETARCLGIGISNAVWGLDADVVVVDGAITAAWHLIEPVLLSQMPDNDSLAGFKVLLRPSTLRGEAALVGAATLPLTTVFATGESRRLAGVPA